MKNRYDFIMFKIIPILLITTSLYASPIQNIKQSSSIERSLHLLKSIQDKGIILGSGEQIVYVFIDPMCKYSRKFIHNVTSNKKMLKKYKYILFLYSIPRLKSKNVVLAVYESTKPLATLMKIMLDDKYYSSTGNKEGEKNIAMISTVAKIIHVNKRPFLIID